jgi:hypothetical protein
VRFYSSALWDCRSFVLLNFCTAFGSSENYRKRFDDEPWIKKGRKGTRYMLGYTVSGRYLFIVYVLRGKGTARVITAMDMDEKTKKLYKKRGK